MIKYEKFVEYKIILKIYIYMHQKPYKSSLFYNYGTAYSQKKYANA